MVLVPHAKDIPATSSVVTVVVAHLMVQFVMGILPKNVTTWAAFGIMVNVHMDRVKQFLLGSEWQVVKLTMFNSFLAKVIHLTIFRSRQDKTLSWISMKYMSS